MTGRLPRVLVPGLVLAVLAAGCGFHLRGAAVVPAAFARVHVAGPAATGATARALAAALAGAGARTVAARGEADAVLEVMAAATRRRVASVDSRGRATEYELRHTLTFRVTDGEGRELLPEQTVVRVRDFLFNPDNVLGAADEEALLRRRLLEESARLAVGRMARALAAVEAAP